MDPGACLIGQAREPDAAAATQVASVYRALCVLHRTAALTPLQILPALEALLPVCPEPVRVAVVTHLRQRCGPHDAVPEPEFCRYVVEASRGQPVATLVALCRREVERIELSIAHRPSRQQQPTAQDALVHDRPLGPAAHSVDSRREATAATTLGTGTAAMTTLEDESGAYQLRPGGHAFAAFHRPIETLMQSKRPLHSSRSSVTSAVAGPDRPPVTLRPASGMFTSADRTPPAVGIGWAHGAAAPSLATAPVMGLAPPPLPQGRPMHGQVRDRMASTSHILQLEKEATRPAIRGDYVARLYT